MELVDMTDSKSVAFGRGGSSPPTGTILYEEKKQTDESRFFCIWTYLSLSYKDVKAKGFVLGHTYP